MRRPIRRSLTGHKQPDNVAAKPLVADQIRTIVFSDLLGTVITVLS